MIKVRVDYRMKGSVMDDEGIVTTSESCIDIPMMDDIARDLIAYQEKSVYAGPGGRIKRLVEDMAMVQGYRNGAFLKAERVDT